jgi:hypothetical protein
MEELPGVSDLFIGVNIVISRCRSSASCALVQFPVVRRYRSSLIMSRRALRIANQGEVVGQSLMGPIVSVQLPT